MNRQTSRLLTILINSPGQFFHYEELAARLGVSTRSIRNYIQSIQDFFKSQRLSSILAVSDGGITFTGNAEEIGSLLEAAVDNDFYLYRLSPEERAQIILLQLLINGDYCNLYELSEKFNVSRTTLLKDMEQVKRFLSLYGASFAPSMNKGYLLLVDELQRREIILRIIQSSMGAVFSLQREVNIYERFLYDEWNLEDYFPVVKDLLLKTEQQYDLDVSDASFEELLFILSLIVARLRTKNLIEADSYDEKAFQNLLVYDLAEHILHKLSLHYGFAYNEAEVRSLASRFYYTRFYAHPYIENVGDIRLHMALISFLIRIGDDISIPVHVDTKIVNQLESHLRDIDKAHAEGVFLENDYTDQMIGEYPEIYQLIRHHLPILEAASGHPYSRDDTAVILIYLVVAVNRHYKNNLPPRVILVCHTGIGTANFLAEQLNSFFNIRIVAVTSNHKLADVKKTYDYDLILSTVSLQEPEDTWVKVSPMLEEEDILKLQKIFVDMSRMKNQLKLHPIHKTAGKATPTILKEENILLDISCQDWKDVIVRTSAPLLMDGSIDSHYINAMIQSCEINGAYFVFCPGVALAHAAPQDGVRGFGLSLARLKKPISFGHRQHDPVTWCICMAVPEQDGRIQEVLQLMNLFGNASMRTYMEQITDRTSLLNFIKEKTQEDFYEQ